MRKTYIVVISIIVLLTIITLGTYAMFTQDINIGEFVNLTASTLPTESNITEYERITIPASESRTIDLNITNSTSNSLYYGVWYEMVDPSTINSNINIGKLTGSTNATIGQLTVNQTKLVQLLIKNKSNDDIIINIGVGYSSTSNLNLPTGRSVITGEISLSTLPDFILNSNAPLDNINSTYVQNTTPGIDFTQPSSDTNGKGLYIRSGTENNINPIYYYRGAVENNNVYFANFCWKIVRTTETGGLKMIYNGAPTGGSCGTGTTSQTNSTIANSAFNTNYNDAKYVGYTYDNSGVETDSTIKTAIDTWYQTNILTSYDSYIEDTVYCNDREEVTAQEKTQIETAMGLTFSKLYKSAVRIMNTTPSLECTNNADKYTKSNTIGNGKLTYTVGLLAMDEIWIAGVGLDGMNGNWANPASYYLYSGSYWWSLSPIGLNYGIVSVMGVCNNYGLYYCYVNSSNIGARPVISLKPEHNTFEYGNGSGANPYRFVATVPSS